MSVIKLKDKINNVPSGTIIKIGCGGNSFVHCYYKNDMTLKRIELDSKDCLEHSKELLEQDKKSLDNLVQAKALYLSRQIAKVRDDNDFQKVLDETTEKYIKIRQDLVKMIKKRKEYIKKFVPFLERNVVNSYDSDYTYEPNTLIILISGKESGDYWNIDEYAIQHKLKVEEQDKHKEFWEDRPKDKNRKDK